MRVKIRTLLALLCAASIVACHGDGSRGGLLSDAGGDVAGPFSRTYCGGGDIAVCRQALWQALGEAAGDLEAELSSPAVADWQREVADDQIEHRTIGVAGVPAIHWVNRPTFQQVVQLGL